MAYEQADFGKSIHFDSRLLGSVASTPHIQTRPAPMAGGGRPQLSLVPGVPEYLRGKFEIMRPFFATDPIHLRQIFVGLAEDRIGDVLRDALVAVPGVEIGSYPRFDDADHKVKVTVESRDRSAVDRAIAFLLAHVPPDAVVRVE